MCLLQMEYIGGWSADSAAQRCCEVTPVSSSKRGLEKLEQIIIMDLVLSFVNYRFSSFVADQLQGSNES